MAAFVYAALARMRRPNPGPAGCSCAGGVAARSSSAAVATAARSTAAANAPDRPGGRRSVPRQNATRPAPMAGTAMPIARAATGRDKKSDASGFTHAAGGWCGCRRRDGDLARHGCPGRDRPGERRRTVIGAVVPAWRSSGRDFCVAVIAAAAVSAMPRRSTTPHGDLARHRGADPALLPRREMDHRHHRRAVARAPQRGQRVLARAGLPLRRLAAADSAGGPVPAVHPGDTGEIPQADGQPALRDGARARLSRPIRSLPSYRCLPPSATAGGSLSAAAQLAR